jgi:hypothetical protein
MGPDEFQNYLDNLLTRLQGIEDAVERGPAQVAPAAAPIQVIPAPADPTPLLLAIALGAIAVIVAAVALVVARQSTRMLRALRPEAAADPHVEARKKYASLLRRYSELLGVELVTGRGIARGETAVDLRVQLEESLRKLREPGAVELLDEVGDARSTLDELPQAQRAAANGIAAIEVEWSIDRWLADPRRWLADCREQARLEQLGLRSRERALAS